MEIIRVTYGETTLPESAIFVSGDKNKEIPIVLSFFLIQRGNRKIIVDTGCDDLPGFVLTNFQSPVKALEEKGVTVDEITDVIITHVHHDHVACVKYFPQAQIWVQEQEYIRGKSYFKNNFYITTFQEECFIAEGVRAVKIGGHTTGSSVVEVENDGKILVLCGDECYCRYNLQNKIPTASSKVPEKSKAFVEKYSCGPYVCLLCHDED